MEAAVLALVGVLIGTLSSVGFQIWDRRRTREASSLDRARAARTEFLDAIWTRLVLAFKEVHDGPEYEAAATAYSAARTRFLGADIDGALILATWTDLVLTDANQKTLFTLDHALLKHGFVTELICKWMDGDNEAIEVVRTQRAVLGEEHWSAEVRHAATGSSSQPRLGTIASSSSRSAGGVTADTLACMTIDRDGLSLLAQVAATLLVAIAVSGLVTDRTRVPKARRRSLRVAEFVGVGTLLLVTFIATGLATLGVAANSWTFVALAVLAFVGVCAFSAIAGIGLKSRHAED